MKIYREIDPDEILLDAHNLPQFDTDQFEGRIEKPISQLTLSIVGGFFLLLLGVYMTKAWSLQISQGEVFANKSENNRLRHTPIFAARGVIFDRNGVELAWNIPSEDPDVSYRKYKDIPGIAHTVGYVQYPSKDSAGFYYQEDFKGVDGAEQFFNDTLQGGNGLRLIEVDAHGAVQSQNTIKPPKEGQNVQLSIDSRVQSKLYQSIRNVADKVGFVGGGGVIMDVTNGEIIALTSYPEYDSEVMSARTDKALVRKYLNDGSRPFLDRVVNGLYVPGSIVKPYVAIAALNEGVIDPAKKILSTGSISIPNAYDPKKETIFRDWKAHGYVDMRDALAVSSDVYFYAVGGGYKDQKGLGILRIDDYARLFGFGEAVKDSFFSGSAGVIPTPEWKKETFKGDSWRVGDTYITSIGQYGFQVSAIQVVRAVAAIANNGMLIDPVITKGEQAKLVRQIDIPSKYFRIIHEGMRQGVTAGTGSSLNVPYVQLATKSGTAELGVSKENVNSWMTGFWPYQNPKYAFAVVMEKGSRHNLIGAGAAMRELVDWMEKNTPEYFR